jgi:hypothetical protein
MDSGRLIGSGLLLVGSVALALAFCTIFTLQWLGLPRTTNSTRTLVFAFVGTIFGLAGYRLASGTWRGSWQVPHRATALGALFFLGYVARTMLNAPRPQLPALWMLAIAAMALVSWCVVGRQRRSFR